MLSTIESTASRQLEAPFNSSDASAYNPLALLDARRMRVGSIGRTLNAAKAVRSALPTLNVFDIMLERGRLAFLFVLFRDGRLNAVGLPCLLTGDGEFESVKSRLFFRE